MQHLPVPAAHGDAVAGALERLHHPRGAEEGDGVVVLRSGLVVFQRVRPVHKHQAVLLGHHVRAHRLLFATAALLEGEFVALALGLQRVQTSRSSRLSPRFLIQGLCSIVTIGTGTGMFRKDLTDHHNKLLRQNSALQRGRVVAIRSWCDTWTIGDHRI